MHRDCAILKAQMNLLGSRARRLILRGTPLCWSIIETISHITEPGTLVLWKIKSTFHPCHRNFFYFTQFLSQKSRARRCWSLMVEARFSSCSSKSSSYNAYTSRKLIIKESQNSKIVNKGKKSAATFEEQKLNKLQQ